MDAKLSEKLDKLSEVTTSTKVNVQHLQTQVSTITDKMDDLLLWQAEVRMTMKITAAIASVFGGVAGWFVNFIF